MEHLVRLLIGGYGLAAAAAAAVWISGGTVLGAVGVFWIGGALAVIGIAAATADRPDTLSPQQQDSDDAAEAAMLAECLHRWEEDRRTDSPVPEGDRTASGA